jgi:hypothetical protein
MNRPWRKGDERLDLTILGAKRMLKNPKEFYYDPYI